MKNLNFDENPGNRYQVVRYIPTLDDYRKFYLNAWKDDECLSKIEGLVHEMGFESPLKLYADDHAFIEFLLRRKGCYGQQPEIFYDLMEKGTGKVKYGCKYTELVSYHLDEGYAFFTEGNLDFEKLLSLETGIEVGAPRHGKEGRPFWFVSSVENNLFVASAVNPNLVERFKEIFYSCYMIDNEKNSVITVEQYWEDGYDKHNIFISEPNQRAMGLQKDADKIIDNGIPFVQNGIPFFEDPRFLKALEKEPKLELLIPKFLQDRSNITWVS